MYLCTTDVSKKAGLVPKYARAGLWTSEIKEVSRLSTMWTGNDPNMQGPCISQPPVVQFLHQSHKSYPFICTDEAPASKTERKGGDLVHCSLF